MTTTKTFIPVNSALWNHIEQIANDNADCCDRINLYAALVNARAMFGYDYCAGIQTSENYTPEGGLIDETEGAYARDIENALDGLTDCDLRDVFARLGIAEYITANYHDDF